MPRGRAHTPVDAARPSEAVPDAARTAASLSGYDASSCRHLTPEQTLRSRVQGLKLGASCEAAAPHANPTRFREVWAPVDRTCTVLRFSSAHAASVSSFSRVCAARSTVFLESSCAMIAPARKGPLPVSCDACRVRRTKCVRLPGRPGESRQDAPPTPCEGCAKRGARDPCSQVARIPLAEELTARACWRTRQASTASRRESRCVRFSLHALSLCS